VKYQWKIQWENLKFPSITTVSTNNFHSSPLAFSSHEIFEGLQNHSEIMISVNMDIMNMKSSGERAQ
jgi:hypothetical protein